ncbi:MAG: tRNA uridine-5-carboxymethylaminomethyl(34) synthesis GTPase MnmE [Treponema sp.]|nr:tRNA uridine-5-carboxymethylaminomethyl(34) synthesis GTPase MnmE [Treponema sp.]
MKRSYGDDEPIAAFASTPGKSALTIIRCAGKGSIELAAGVFSGPKKLEKAAGNSVIHGWLIKDGEKIDEVLVSVYRAPKSYTGEDSLDISCHGGISAGRAVMDALLECGFAEALPGEFTFRAFMNGKLDLTRGESVMELVNAKTDKGRDRAVQRLSGMLEEEINRIKILLVEVLAGAELYLDYSEDEVSADADEKSGVLPAQDKARTALEQLRKLGAAWNSERIYQEGITAAIAGLPNAGKSSLFNYLLKEDRSIVTDIPGTTRDWIEAWLSIEGIPVRLIDTAGLRESADTIEALGVQRTRELIDSADLILYLIDGKRGITGEDKTFQAEHNSKPLLRLWNKADIAPMPQNLSEQGIIAVSAHTGQGIAELSRAIAATIRSASGGSGESGGGELSAAPGSQRQKDLIDAAIFALEEALSLAGESGPLDLIAPLLREAINALGEITGEVSSADILEEIFSRFCVGK